MGQDEKKTWINPKHKYSTIALVMFGLLLLIGSAISITSEDVDLLCSISNSILYRNSTGWSCGEISDVLTHYTPTTISSITTAVGDGSELTTCLDNDWFEIQEESGSPALNANFTFTNVENFRNIIICQEYTGVHDLHMSIYNHNINQFVTLNDIGQTDSINCNYKNIGGDATPFIQNGEVIIQIDHPQNGVASHREYIDCIKLER